jgi:hypothetical protein
LQPEVFLISGGGNDLVGGSRLASMVRADFQNEPESLFKMKKRLRTIRSENVYPRTSLDLDKYRQGMQFIKAEFFDFMNICFLQYFIFFQNLIQNSVDYKNTLFISQGYDFAIPSLKKWRGWNPVTALVNFFNKSGKWLYTPLALAKIQEDEDKEAVLYSMIYEFNEMLSQLARCNNFPNLFHIDSRGLAKYEDWYDELHLKSSSFEKVSLTFRKCISENAKKPFSEMKKEKIYKVKA